MGEIHYVWADPGAVRQQLAMSSLVQAMFEKGAMAIARWITKDGSDPRMGVLSPCVFENVECFLWAPVGADDPFFEHTLTLCNLDAFCRRRQKVYFRVFGQPCY
jgi:ATP-dependent DNA helicase 2 subunit 2